MCFEDKSDRELFLKYATPCASDPDKLISKLEGGRDIKLDLEESFPSAMKMLEVLANQRGKEVIDASVIRDYFWKEHARFLKENNAGDSDLMKCVVLPGKVIGGEEVRLLNQEKRCIDFSLIAQVDRGNWVTVHWNYGIEGISEDDKDEIESFLRELGLLD